MGTAGFDELYAAELAGQVRRATLLVGDAQLARDLVHDAFTEVFARWDSLREPAPYLHRAVMNRCRDHQRSQRRRSQPRPVAPHDGADHDVLWDALAVLPFRHRAAIVLRFHYQLTDREIADALDCRPGSVGPWIHRGLQRLRKELA